MKLSRQVHKFNARVEFLVLTFKHDLADAVVRYELWDNGFEGLGERQFDNCFEMGDSAEVIAELITTARREGFVEKIQTWCGNDSFARWSSYADRQGELFAD
ncbi:hypothetical protein ALQ02_01467 [Pseudomonas savastanoi pv. phaseolicola]|nr:hypothetical protein ALQ02_01467 [Pseudomonas savastanoi pv. phaseolicola]